MSRRLTVSLSALAANYRLLTSAAQGTVAAVVKANAYGLGAAEIATRLVQEGCREFFVATAVEGVQLRKALTDAGIYVLEGAYAENLSDLIGAGLIPVLNTPAQCQSWIAAKRPAALHIDTGMQRLGFSYAQGVDALLALPFELCLFVSHFARADEPTHETVAEQMHRASPLYALLKTKHRAMRLSLCNSAGLLEGLGPEDVGRAGIALYGGNPYSLQANPMQPVAKLEARVMQIRELPPATPVGYGGSFVTQRDTKVATLGIGYADGVPRLLSNNGVVFVAGAVCPIIGRISMDLMSVDVSGLVVSEGDWAEVIGAQVHLDEVASHAQTLAYEVLNHINDRVPRFYVEGSL